MRKLQQKAHDTKLTLDHFSMYSSRQPKLSSIYQKKKRLADLQHQVISLRKYIKCTQTEPFSIQINYYITSLTA